MQLKSSFLNQDRASIFATLRGHTKIYQIRKHNAIAFWGQTLTNKDWEPILATLWGHIEIIQF